ncbi:hypothetical protein D6C76_06298 [Aureobasidium pullulans]|nr:hypothetical protein D6C79_00592 [Aureobasidium pullulans]TIA74516.1 hypothetical protein D6C76_06298 [Aureobasidium pullulans]
MFLTYLILFFLSLVGDALGQITAAPSYPILADPWHSRVGLLIQKRAAVTWCDSSSKFYCFLPAACVSGRDGFIGCCTAIGTTCAPRTECIDYTSGLPTPCDYVTGSCVYCSDSNLPFCTTQYRDNKYVLGCGTEHLTTTYTNTGTDTKSAILAFPTAVALPTSIASALSTTSSSSTPSAAPSSTSLATKTSSANDPEAPSSQPSGELSVSPSLLASSTTSPTSPSKAIDTSASTLAASNSSMASSRGLIIGVVIGAAAGSIILLSVIFILWKCWKRRRAAGGRSSKEESNKAGYSLGTNEDSVTEHNNSPHGVAGEQVDSHGPGELEEELRRATERMPGVEHAYSATPGLGSSVQHENHQPYSPEDVRGAAEAPADAPVWPSPNPTTMTSPTPSNSSLWMVSPAIGTPRAPSQYTAYKPFTPSSDYSNNGQPPSSLPRSRYGGGDVTQESPLAELEAHEVGRAQ